MDVFVLLTLALTGESPTCTLHEGTHRVTRAIEVSHAACYDSSGRTVAPPTSLNGGGFLEQREQSATVTHFRTFLFY